MAVVTNLKPTDHVAESLFGISDHLFIVPVNTRKRPNSLNKRNHILGNLVSADMAARSSLQNQ